jgi:hypothetical protein
MATDPVRAIRESWGIVRPRPYLVPPPVVPTRWTPCTHWGGTRKCASCERPKAAGVMVKAQSLYEGYRDFVRARIHAELLPYTNGGSFKEFSDLESDVWHNVARKIESYEDRGTPMAWLKVVVRSTVNDHFDSQWAKKRDIRLETLFGDTSTLTTDAVHAKPTSPTGKGPTPMTLPCPSTGNE